VKWEKDGKVYRLRWRSGSNNHMIWIAKAELVNFRKVICWVWRLGNRASGMEFSLKEAKEAAECCARRWGAA
jgi:hypothetical protein